ncbi:MAG: DUF58 domain-containing protein [Haloferacaceae archaeon]
MRTRLTRRGWALAGVVALGVVLAARHGARSLNAVVLPCLVALVAAAVRARRTNVPTATRSLPPPAPAGTGGEVTLRFAPEDPVAARVRDDLPAALDGDPTAETVLGAEPVRYRVRRRRRGRHPVGPAAVYTTDVLGLAETRRDAGGRDALLVYPPVRDLPAATLGLVRAAVADERTSDRDEFASLREYVRGDALRDVNWKASAKRDDLVVTEFAGAQPRTAVALAAGGEDERGDAMAEAAATLGDALLREGVPVTLRTADEAVTVDPGEREDLLAALATARPGVVADASAADVAVDARADGVRVRIGGVETAFERLVSGEVGPGTGGSTVEEDAAPADDADRRDGEDGRDGERDPEVRA